MFSIVPKGWPSTLNLIVATGLIKYQTAMLNVSGFYISSSLHLLDMFFIFFRHHTRASYKSKIPAESGR